MTVQRAAGRVAISQALRGAVSPVTVSATDAVRAQQALIDAEVEQSEIDEEVADSPDLMLQACLEHASAAVTWCSRRWPPRQDASWT